MIDGVVNTPIWREYVENGKKVFKCKFAWPHDGFVNNFQAICWLNDLYTKYPYDIVITSSWREDCRDYTPAECLYNGGLSKNIEIIDCVDAGVERDELIDAWLKRNEFKGEYVIFDDEDSYYYFSILENAQDLRNRFIKTDDCIGITCHEALKAEDIFRNYENKKKIDCGDEITPYNK